MKLYSILSLALAVAAVGCTRVEPVAVAKGVEWPAPTPQVEPVPAQAAQVVQVAAKADDSPPRCDDARAEELVKEAFIRRVLVYGDKALIERGALDPADAFTERQIVEAMPRMLAMGRLQQVEERGFDGQRRRCTARLAVDGWKDLQPPAAFHIVVVPDAARFGVESDVRLLPGAEGFNMMIGYRSTFGKAIH